MEGKSVIKKINKQDPWNDLFKFEMEFEDGSKGMMYKKTDDPKCEVGDEVNFTLNEKGTIKIITESQQQYQQQFSGMGKGSSDDIIMIQTMFKSAASFDAHRSNGTSENVIRSAKMFFNAAKDILKNKEVEVEKEDAPF